MADNDNNKGTLGNDFSSISDEEAITEINFGDFLADTEGDTVLFEGFHEDIEKAEKSLGDELQSLYDDIMSGTMPSSDAKPEEETAGAEDDPFGDLWMSPEEYIELGSSAPSENSVEDAPSPETADARDELFSMIESLKSDADLDTGFSDILDDIESDESIAEIPEAGEIENMDSVADGNPAAGAENESAEEPAPAQATVYVTDSKEFNDELDALLGVSTAGSGTVQETPSPAAEEKDTVEEFVPSAKKAPFVITIPEDEPAKPEAPVDNLIPHGNRQPTVGVEPVEITEDDGKIAKKDRRAAKKEARELAGEGRGKGGEIVRKIVLAVSIIVILVSAGVLVNTYVIEPYMFKKQQKSVSDSVGTDQGYTNNNVVEPGSGYPEGMFKKYTKLYDINPDLRGWISIPALEINLPVAQGTDNDYYLHRNIYKKRTNYGVPFFDYRMKDFKNLPRNTVIYGHNMHYDDLIFGMLENYRDISGFQKSPTIECNTIYGDHTWFVYAVFISNSKVSDDNGYVFPYNFIDITETKFVEYINEIDKRKFYTTGVDILSTDKILTLSTCCYDFDSARLVVVARLRREGESLSVDTSQAVKNENPKYPQAWYDANKKQNPYREDARWNPNTTV